MAYTLDKWLVRGRLVSLFCLLIALVGCSDGSDGTGGSDVPLDSQLETTPSESEQKIGFEIIEAQGPNSLRAWISSDITLEEFDALELPPGWIKNQPREGGTGVDGPDAGRFLRSPDSAEDGEFLDEEFFGFTWRHSATVVQAGRPMDDQGILTGSSVRKFHELTFNSGSTVVLLISPAGSVYFRIGRDANRTSDEPTVPTGWRLMEYVTPVDLVFDLYPRNTVIRTDNQDSFQGPVVIEELIASGEVPDPYDIAPLELTTDICDDPANMDVIQDALIWRVVAERNGLNLELAERMIAEPTRGPFYMLNLIRYRELADYPDGRESSLTGREANNLYSPVDFLSAIGAAPVFVGPVSAQLEGDDVLWEDVAVVEYPCPAGFFAMTSDPAFLDRLIHKDAGVETTIVMVTYLRSPAEGNGAEAAPGSFTELPGDPAFEFVEVLDFRDTAEYEPGSGEPLRTGAEAWAEFQAADRTAAEAVGAEVTAVLEVQGVFQGVSERTWDEAHFVRMPSLAGFEALQTDQSRQAALYHRDAALADNYALVTNPLINNIPTGSDDVQAPPAALPITEAGVGMICTSDADCVGIGFCLSDGSGPGFCSRMCGSGECGEPYVCCFACSELVAAQLPFSESACLLEQAAMSLGSAPVSCTCQ
ncbi:MAG: hypothetical protein AAGA91_17160 [Pseudomonadota bacterium]